MMDVEGERPDAKPIHHGEFEPERVYLQGDTVTSEGATYEALTDFRAGLLPPATVAIDAPGQFWRMVRASARPTMRRTA